jgi:hypothetical protein
MRHGRRWHILRRSAGANGVVPLDAMSSVGVVTSGPAESTGVLLFATGDPCYGEMAYGLAATVKACNPGLPIAIVTDETACESLDVSDRAMFDQTIRCPRECVQVEGVATPLYLKACADLLTPFDRTLVIDVDSALFPNARLGPIFERYADYDLAAACTRVFEAGPGPDGRLICWADVSALRRRFDIAGPISELHAYYYYFRRSRASSYFARCREMYRDVMLRPIPGMRFWRGDRVASVEMVMAAATGACDVKLYPGRHRPLVQDNSGLPPERQVLSRMFLGFTFCSQRPTEPWLRLYAQTVTDAAAVLGVRPARLWSRKPGIPLAG